MTNSRRTYESGLASILLAGTVLISSQPAFANHRNLEMDVFRGRHADVKRDFRRSVRESNMAERLSGFDSSIASPAMTVNQPAMLDRVSGLSPYALSRASHRTLQLNDCGRMVSTRNGIDLDLSSANSNVTLGSKLFGGAGSVTIKVGEESKSVFAGHQVTAAEYIAVKQVLSQGRQQISLDKDGRAVGGTFDVSQITSRNDQINADDVIIPASVTGYGDFGRRSNFEIDGDLINAGSIVASSSARGGRAEFQIACANVVNQQGGQILTSANQNAVSDAGKPTPVDLEIRARDSVKNSGTIAASGDLTITAGGLLDNQGIITARGELTAEAPSVVNSGLIQSIESDVTLTASVPTALNVNNQGGAIQALVGAINVRDPRYRENFNTIVYGGDLLSSAVNVFTGEGTADISVDKLTGILNQKGLASHVFANTENLILGDICLTGDPTYNTTGSMTIAGSISVGEALTLIAGGDISNSVPLTISAADGNTGFNITIVAGANITAGGTTTPVVGPIPPQPAGVATTINGPSATGGNVLFSNELNPVTISTRSTATSGNHNGGNVTIAAFANSGGGIAFLDEATILTGGLGTGTNGNVTVIAESVITADIDTTGGATTTGNVTLSAAQPSSGAVVFNANGNLTSGAIAAGSFANSGGVSLQGSVTAGQSISATGAVIRFSPGVTLATVSANGLVSLDGLDPTPSGGGSTLDFGSNNFISTTTLNMDSAGDIGSSLSPARTNATFINAATTGAFSIVNVVGTNPDLVVFQANASSGIKAQFQGSVVSDPGGPVTTTGGVLSIESLTGNIGAAAASPFEFDAGIVVFRAPEGSVFAEGDSDTLLRGNDPSLAAETFLLRIVNGNNINSNADSSVTAKNVILESIGGSVALQGAYSGSQSISVTSDTALFDSSITGTLSTPHLFLRSISGNIGSAGDRFDIQPTITSAELVSDQGAVFAAGPNVKTFTLTGGFSDNNFDYLGVGTTVVSGNITVAGNGTLDIETANFTLEIKPNVVLSVAGGNLNLIVSAPTAVAKKSKIVIGKNAQLLTDSPGGLGDITLSVGDVSAPVAGIKPKNVTAAAVAPGAVFFGQFGVKAKAPLNTLYAKGADVVINNPLSAKNIALGGGVVIIADPPVSAAQMTPEAIELERQLAGGGAGGGVFRAPVWSNLPLTELQPDNRAVNRSYADLDSNLGNLDQTLVTARLTGLSRPRTAIEDDSYMSLAPCFAVDARVILSGSDLSSGLSHGGFVVASDKDLRFDTAFGRVGLGEGSVVFIHHNDNGLALFNLHDEKKQSVSLSVAGRKVMVAPGTHVLISKCEDSFAEANQIPAIGHRRLKHSRLAESRTLYSSEFSVPSAVQSIASVQELLASPQATSRKLTNKILKTSAVLMHLGGSEPYLRYGRQPSVRLANRP